MSPEEDLDEYDEDDDFIARDDEVEVRYTGGNE